VPVKFVRIAGHLSLNSGIVGDAYDHPIVWKDH
jgi:hypothetical protein